MKFYPLLPKLASVAFAVALLSGLNQLHAETAKGVKPARTADADTAMLPQPGPWLLAAGALALGASHVRWRGKRQAA